MNFSPDYSDLKKKDPRNPWPYLAEARDHVRRRQYGAAVYEFDEALRRLPLARSGQETPNFKMFFEIHYERGLAHLASGKLDLALQDFTAVAAAADKVENFYLHNPEFDTPCVDIVASLRRLMARAEEQRQATADKMQERKKRR